MFSPIQQVTGSTLGIIGFGNIGKAVAEKAKGFKMEILYYSRTRKEDQEKQLGKIFFDHHHSMSFPCSVVHRVQTKVCHLDLLLASEY